MRVFLGGRAVPREEFALSEAAVNSGELPVTLVFEENDVFRPEDYLALGFTRFEVWAIGAPGGKAGSDSFPFGGGGQSSAAAAGGAGGGGGLHHVTGFLEDLPEELDIVVGQEGAPGAQANHEPPRLVTSLGRKTYVGPTPNTIAIWMDITNWRFENAYTIVNPAWVPAQPGGDGGYSAFGDVCKASGGKGGKAPLVEFATGEFWWIWPDPSTWGAYSPGTSNPGVLDPAFYRMKFDGGDGGEGGAGNRTVAGGGGAGAYSYEGAYIGYSQNDISFQVNRSYVTAKDGTWDSTVGKGGGGGRGGVGFTWYYPPILMGV